MAAPASSSSSTPAVNSFRVAVNSYEGITPLAKLYNLVTWDKKKRGITGSNCTIDELRSIHGAIVGYCARARAQSAAGTGPVFVLPAVLSQMDKAISFFTDVHVINFPRAKMVIAPSNLKTTGKHKVPLAAVNADIKRAEDETAEIRQTERIRYLDAIIASRPNESEFARVAVHAAAAAALLPPSHGVLIVPISSIPSGFQSVFARGPKATPPPRASANPSWFGGAFSSQPVDAQWREKLEQPESAGELEEVMTAMQAANGSHWKLFRFDREKLALALLTYPDVLVNNPVLKKKATDTYTVNLITLLADAHDPTLPVYSHFQVEDARTLLYQVCIQLRDAHFARPDVIASDSFNATKAAYDTARTAPMHATIGTLQARVVQLEAEIKGVQDDLATRTVERDTGLREISRLDMERNSALAALNTATAAYEETATLFNLRFLASHSRDPRMEVRIKQFLRAQQAMADAFEAAVAKVDPASATYTTDMGRVMDKAEEKLADMSAMLASAVLSPTPRLSRASSASSSTPSTPPTPLARSLSFSSMPGLDGFAATPPSSPRASKQHRMVLAFAAMVQCAAA